MSGDAAAGAATAGTELTSARLARVGDIEVRRLLPLRHRRSVGAWCFVDHYGPLSVDGAAGMQVPPHPHIGLSIAARAESSLFLLGGEPLGEPLLMWWNFVARTPEEIIAAARDWGEGIRFGKIAGYRGAPLAAPPVDAVRLARRAERANPSQ